LQEMFFLSAVVRQTSVIS